MAWRRGTKLEKTTGKLSFMHLPLQVQSAEAVDAADPSKGTRIRCLAASDSINSGRIRIRASAWRFRRQGAPMLYEHGNDARVGRLPIGRWDKFEVQEGVGLIAEGTVEHFEQSDPRAVVVADIRAKRLTDVSVGHCPSKLGIAKQDGEEYLDVQSTELGEISVVAVGMDGSATYEIMEASALGYEWIDDSSSTTPPDPAKDNGGNMDRKLLIQMLNMSGAALAEDANDAQILAAMQNMTQSARLGVKAGDVLSALGLKEDATVETVRQSIASLKQPTNFVPKAQYDELLKKQAAAEIESLIAGTKQIPEGQKAFAKMLLLQGHTEGTEGRKLFDQWAQSLPPLRTAPHTGAGAGTPPQGAGAGAGDDDMQITEEDEKWCQTLGYFRDERGADGRVTVKGVDRMIQMAEVSSSEALEWMFGQAVPETDMDKMMREARRQQLQQK